MIRDLPTRLVLLAGFLAAGLVPVMVVALVSYAAGRTELKEQALRQLESVRNLERTQLQRFFESRLRDADLLAADPSVQHAFTDLAAAFHAAAGPLKGLDRRRFEAPDAYRAVHDLHAGFLSRYVDTQGYYDLLLLDPVTGEAVFSVEKESDFATPVTRQPTALTEVWRRVVQDGRVVLSDTRPYGPSANAAAQFVAAPIVVDGHLAGVLALQISLHEVDTIMEERSGLGRTGEALLVGADLRPRCDSPLDPTRRVQAAFREPEPPTLATSAVRSALAGEAGSGLVKELDGRSVLAAWTPFDVAGLRWALVARIDEAEIEAQIDDALNRKIAILLLVSGIVVVVLALGVSLLITRSIADVRTRLGQLSDAVLTGDLHQRVDEHAVAADFREVVRHINHLADAFAEHLDFVPDPVIIVDAEGRLRFANEAALALAGKPREELEGRPCAEAFCRLSCGESGCPASRAARDRSIVRTEASNADGSSHWLVTASPLPDGRGGFGGLEVLIDRTAAVRGAEERRALEERLARMQRLEAIGTLAGGIAHDFNNILTYLFACADIVQGLLPPNSPAAPHLDALLAAVERAADLVRQILTFSRQAHGDRHPLDLGPLVKEAVKLVQATLAPGIRVEVDVPNRPFHVLANAAQLHQLVMNLLTNAHHALRDRGGVLSVSLSDVELDASTIPAGLALQPGAYRVLRVADTGVGMDERTLARAFEPFFTTRPVGQGTGMGLALVHGIVTGSGGAIAVDSRVGQGSTFTAYLPRADAAPATTAPVEAELARGEGRHVLFVDDEPQVCAAGQQMLESLGYRVTSAPGGPEAIAELQADPGTFDVVFTDLRMPVVDGLAVAEAARALRPDLPVVLTTASTDGPTADLARERGVSEIVLKPYRRSDLARLLHSLGRRETG